jgi:hypothetical protein
MAEASKRDANEVDLATARLIKLRAESETALLRVQALRAELHRAPDVQIVMNDLLSRIRAIFRAIPDAVAPRVLARNKSHTEIFDLLTDVVNQGLEQATHYDEAGFTQRNPEYAAQAGLTDL